MTQNATLPETNIYHLSEWTRAGLAALRARRADLSGMSPDELRANTLLATRGRRSVGVAEPDGLGLIAEGELSLDGEWHYSEALVTNPAEFAARFGLPVTHERALRLLMNGALTADETRAMVEAFDDHSDRHRGDF